MVKLNLLCDALFVTDIRTFLPDGDSYKYPAASKSLLIQDGKEKILIDTGIADIPKGPRYDFLRSALTVKRANFGLKKQLAQLGIAPRDITMVINTHLHAAHSGHGNLFTNARIYISKEEFRYYHNLEEDDPKKLVYQPSNFEKLENVEETTGEYRVNDLVRVIPTPGHTEGHLSVVIGVNGKNYIYAADVSPLKVNLQKKIAMNGYDRPMILEQMARLMKIKNARWIFCHDSDQLSMRQAYAPKAA